MNAELTFDGSVLFTQAGVLSPSPGRLRLRLCEKQRSISAVLSASNPPLSLPFSLDEGEPISFDDVSSSCSWLHGQFFFHDTWEYGSFQRFYSRVRAAFELRMLHQTLVEDVGMPVDQLPDFVPAKRVYTAGANTGGRSLPFLAGLEDGVEGEGGWGPSQGGEGGAGSEETMAIIMAAAERARREEATRRRPGIPMLLSDGMQLPPSHAQGGSGEGHPPPCPTTAHATYTLPARVADKYVHPGRSCGDALHMPGASDTSSYACLDVYNLYLRCLGLLPDGRAGGVGVGMQDVFATCNRVPQELVTETSGLMIQPAANERGGNSGRLLAAGAGAAILPFAQLLPASSKAMGWSRVSEHEDKGKRCCALCSRAPPASSSTALGLHPFVPVNGSGDPVWACSDCMARVLDRRLRCVEKGKIIDTDASELTCALCGLAMGSDGGITEGETLVVCSAIRCPRSYCPTCIELLLNKKQRAAMEAEDEWLCPPCAAHSSTPCGLADGSCYSLHRRLPTPEEALNTPLSVFVPASARAALGMDDEEEEEQAGAPGRRGRGGWNRGMRGGPRVQAMNVVWKQVDPYRESSTGAGAGDMSPWTPASALSAGTPVGSGPAGGSKRERAFRSVLEADGLEEVVEEDGGGLYSSSSGVRSKRSRQQAAERANPGLQEGSLFALAPSTLPPLGQPDLHSQYSSLFGQAYTGLVDFHLHSLLYANHVKEVRRRTDPTVDPVTVLETENECCLCKDGGNVLECDWTTHDYYKKTIKAAAVPSSGRPKKASKVPSSAGGGPSLSHAAAEPAQAASSPTGAGETAQGKEQVDKVPYGGKPRTWAATQARMLAKRRKEALAVSAAASAWLGKDSASAFALSLGPTDTSNLPSAMQVDGSAHVTGGSGEEIEEVGDEQSVSVDGGRCDEALSHCEDKGEGQGHGNAGAAHVGEDEPMLEHSTADVSVQREAQSATQAAAQASGGMGANTETEQKAEGGEAGDHGIELPEGEHRVWAARDNDSVEEDEERNVAKPPDTSGPENPLHAAPSLPRLDSAVEGGHAGLQALPAAEPASGLPAPKRRGRPPRPKPTGEQPVTPSGPALPSFAVLLKDLPSVRCPKVYHQECLGYTVGDSGQWHCPRHTCRDCSALASAFCKYCPNSFCSTHAARVLGRGVLALAAHQASQAAWVRGLMAQGGAGGAGGAATADNETARLEDGNVQAPAHPPSDAQPGTMPASEAASSNHQAGSASPTGEGVVHPLTVSEVSSGSAAAPMFSGDPSRPHPWHPMDLAQVCAPEDESPVALSLASRTVLPVLAVAVTGPWADAVALPTWPGRRAPDADIPQGCSQILCPTCAVWVASCVDRRVLEPEPCSGRPPFPVTHVKMQVTDAAGSSSDGMQAGQPPLPIPLPSPEDGHALLQTMAARMGPFAQFVRWQQARRTRLMEYAANAAAHALSALPSDLLSAATVPPARGTQAEVEGEDVQEVVQAQGAGLPVSGTAEGSHSSAGSIAPAIPPSAIPLLPPPLDLSSAAWVQYQEARAREKKAGGDKGAARKRASAAGGFNAASIPTAGNTASRARTADLLMPGIDTLAAAPPRKQYKRRPAVDWRTLSEEHVQMLLAGLDHETGLRRVGRPPNWLKELFAARGIVLHPGPAGEGEEGEGEEQPTLAQGATAVSAEDEEMEGQDV